MIIDDETFYQKYLGTLLEAEGYEILVAPDASEASKMIEKEIPDVIVSDIAMPHLSVFQFLNYVQERFQKSIPFIIVSAFENKEMIEMCYEAGADAYFVKPLNPEDLTNYIHLLNLKHNETTEKHFINN